MEDARDDGGVKEGRGAQLTVDAREATEPGTRPGFGNWRWLAGDEGSAEEA